MILPVIQIILAVGIVVLILLQERSAGMSGLFGGGEGGGIYQTRRGLEKIVFYATIIGSIVFVAIAVAQLFLAK